GLWRQYRQRGDRGRKALFRAAERVSLSQGSRRGLHLQRQGHFRACPNQDRGRSDLAQGRSGGGRQRPDGRRPQRRPARRRGEFHAGACPGQRALPARARGGVGVTTAVIAAKPSEGRRCFRSPMTRQSILFARIFLRWMAGSSPAMTNLARGGNHAARILPRNCVTWLPSCWLWISSVFEATLTLSAAAAAASASALTPVMLSDTFLVPCAACWVLREISWVAAPCSWTAAAIAVATSLTSPMMPPMLLMASMASPATFWMSAICSEISSVAFAVWLASDFTSDATTAKPRPASPARAASMVAFSASRLVCAAMVLIRPTTSPIRPADFASPCTVPSVSRAWLTARLAIPAACAACWLISLIEALNSTEAEATLSTLIEASPDARCATSTRSLVWRETADRPEDVVRIWLDASPSCCSVWCTTVSNSPTWAS